MSGDGKRGAGQWPQATAPILDSTTFTVDGSAASRPFLEGKAEVQDKRSPLLSKSVGPQSSSSAQLERIALSTTRSAGAKVWSEMNAQDWLRESVHEHPKSGPADRRPARRAVPRSLPREGVGQGRQGSAAAGEGYRCARHG